ncbi:hypothetical protein [Cupriavidus pinatubonensis]|uniref:hypothetical protein n=1 Tax=Cupriavidus pinatubonensis TaxID=248026 RepID=UPI0036116696
MRIVAFLCGGIARHRGPLAIAGESQTCKRLLEQFQKTLQVGGITRNLVGTRARRHGSVTIGRNS